MIERYGDADAFVNIEEKEYALYKRGPLSKYPHMIDISTGRIPHGEQRELMNSYLRSNNINPDPHTHGRIRQAIKLAQGEN